MATEPPLRPPEDPCPLRTPEEQACVTQLWARYEEFRQAQEAMLQEERAKIGLIVDHIFCTDRLPRQVGIIGHRPDGRSVAIDLYRPFAMATLGLPGEGKSWLLGALVENASMNISGINNLAAPHCVISLHYYASITYQSEFLKSAYPVTDPEQLEVLRQHDVVPQGHPDVLALTYADHTLEMRSRHPHAQVHGLKFPFRELNHQAVRILMGLAEKQTPFYSREVSQMLRELRAGAPVATWAEFVDKVNQYDFTTSVHDLVMQRLKVASQWIDDGRSIKGYVKPGRHIILDICSEWLTEEEAMMLFALAIEVLVFSSGHAGQGRRCPLLLCFDEAHVFTAWPPVRKQMDRMLRLRRHLLTSIVIASQDLPSIPNSFLPLMDAVAMFQNQAEDWLQILRKKIRAFGLLRIEHLMKLKKGQMWLWSRAWHTCEEPVTIEDSDENEEETPQEQPLDGTALVLVSVRPRVTCHGGETATAEPLESWPAA